MNEKIIQKRRITTRRSAFPIFFIICTKALIANIKKAERKKKKLIGLKVARACPAISHLLFVDDSLFFCKAQKEECQKKI